MTDGKEPFGLDFEEKDLIACLMDPILVWNDAERLNELCQQMTAGDKGVFDKEEYNEYMAHVKQVLKELNKRLGYA